MTDEPSVDEHVGLDAEPGLTPPLHLFSYLEDEFVEICHTLAGDYKKALTWLAEKWQSAKV